MQNEKEEKKLILLIKYGLPVFVVLISLLIMIFLYREYQKDLNNERVKLENEYIKNKKLLLKERVNTIHHYIINQQKTNKKLLKQQIKNQVYMAHAISTNIYNKNKNTQSKTQITHQIKNALQNIRFNNGRGYFFIYDMEATNIFHPTKPEREGKNYFYDKDITGVYRNQIALNVIKKQGEGFFQWYFHKPNNPLKEYKKIGFVKKFEPYDWFIGSGEYEEDIENDLKEEMLDYISQFKFIHDGFIGVIDYNGNFLYHPNQKVLNSNIFKEKRFNHINKFYKNLLQSKNLDGYNTHQMKIQGVQIKDETKTLYVKKLDSWGWFIATGFRSSDSNPIIEQMKLDLENQYKKDSKTILMYAIILFILLISISFYISRLLKNKFLNYSLDLEKQIENNIAQKEVLLKAQEVAHIGDWQLDIKTNTAKWSNEILKIFGIEHHNAVFGPDYLKKIIHPNDFHNFSCSIENCVKYKSEHRVVYRIYRPNGEIRWIDCRGQLNKTTETIIGTVQDITETKELEIEKQKQDEMLLSQSRSAAMGEMISMIAHQWRQPLTVIAMNANNTLIDIELDNYSAEDAKENANSILKQTNHLSQTINDFRDFFKPNKQKSEESIAKVINDSISFMSKVLSDNEISYKLNCEKDEKTLIYQRELIQVFINIIKNAKEALIEHTKESRQINITVIHKKDTTIINICNNGGQIKESNLTKIFEPYFSTKNENNGTGLGLYMCKLIIEKHMNGKLLVNNIADGVCFSIHLPKITKA